MTDKTNYMSATILRSFPLELMPGETDLSRTGVNMPIGTIPCGVIPVDDGYHVLAMCEPAIKPRAWHAIQLALADEVVNPLLGRRFGAPIAVLKMHHGQPVAFLPDLPWPASENGGVQ